MDALRLPVSHGDAADRISILEIKRERIDDAVKRRHVEAELDAVTIAFFAAVPDTSEFRVLFAKLKSLNETLWEVEDDIRNCEARGDFGEAFIALARRVYLTNDERAQVKREINRLFGSPLEEQKSYADYKRP